MKRIWNIARNTLGIIGAILAFGAIGDMDYHLIELGQAEPASAWTTLCVGILMMVPSVVHVLRGDY